MLRVGVVGVGHLGREHARVWEALEGADFVGVADRDTERAAAVGRSLGVPWFAAAEDLAAQGLDAASVATTTGSHEPVALALLERGVAVLVEKPIARTLEEADRMIEAARRGGLALAVGHIERFNPVVAAARPFVHKPLYIECDRVHRLSFRSLDVSVVMDLMIHDIDLVLDLVGAPVESLEALGTPVLTGAEDLAIARIRFANGCQALAKASRVALERSRKMRIFCRDTYLSLDFVARRGTRIAVPEGMDRATVERAATRGTFRELLSIEPLVIGDDEPLRLELESFAEAVRHGTPPLVPGEQGREAMACALRVQEAIAQSRRLVEDVDT